MGHPYPSDRANPDISASGTFSNAANAARASQPDPGSHNQLVHLGGVVWGRRILVNRPNSVIWETADGNLVKVIHRQQVIKRARAGSQFTQVLQLQTRTAHLPLVFAVHDLPHVLLVVMERVPGQALPEAANDCSASGKCQLVAGMFEAISEIHRLDALLGDVSPGNFICNEHRRIVYIDLDSLSPAKNNRYFFTIAGVSGTDGYVAPEVERESRFTRESDVYAGAKIAYELLKGQIAPSLLEATVAPMLRMQPGSRPSASRAAAKFRRLAIRIDPRIKGFRRAYALFVTAAGARGPLAARWLLVVCVVGGAVALDRNTRKTTSSSPECPAVAAAPARVGTDTPPSASDVPTACASSPGSPGTSAGAAAAADVPSNGGGAPTGKPSAEPAPGATSNSSSSNPPPNHSTVGAPNKRPKDPTGVRPSAGEDTRTHPQRGQGEENE